MSGHVSSSVAGEALVIHVTTTVCSDGFTRTVSGQNASSWPFFRPHARNGSVRNAEERDRGLWAKRTPQGHHARNPAPKAFDHPPLINAIHGSSFPKEGRPRVAEGSNYGNEVRILPRSFAARSSMSILDRSVDLAIRFFEPLHRRTKGQEAISGLSNELLLPLVNNYNRRRQRGGVEGIPTPAAIPLAALPTDESADAGWPARLRVQYSSLGGIHARQCLHVERAGPRPG